MSSPRRFEVYLVDPGLTIGSEMKKPRPYVVVSPDELNQKIATVIAVPLTSVQRSWDFRVPIHFQGKAGDMALDQIRTLDKSRLLRFLGEIEPSLGDTLLRKLRQLFDP